MNDMRKLMEASAQLFDDRVEADTDRYYADMDRREQEAEESLPYDIADAENYFLNEPTGKAEFADFFLENLVENPREFDIDLMIGIVQDYFRNLGNKPLPGQFAESETMNDVLADYLQKQGYNLDAREIEQYRSRTDESLWDEHDELDRSWKGTVHNPNRDENVSPWLDAYRRRRREAEDKFKIDRKD